MRPPNNCVLDSVEVEALRELGWGAWQDQALSPLRIESESVARVGRQQGAGLWLDTGAERLAAVLSGRFKYAAASAFDLPVVGDWVTFRRREPGAADALLVQSLIPRQTTLARRRAGSRMDSQLLAANVDLALIVWGLDRPPNIRLLQRAAVLAAAGGIAAQIVLTKVDACCSGSQEASALAARLSLPVLAVSAITGHGLGALMRQLAVGRTAVMIGPSGAGKSSLVNALLGATASRVDAVRGSDRKGRHTTTHRELFRIPGAGLILDGPGMREFGLVGDCSALDIGFADVAAVAEACADSECDHGGAPGCAVLGAVRAGKLDAQRVLDYRVLLAELAGTTVPRERRAGLRQNSRRRTR